VARSPELDRPNLSRSHAAFKRYWLAEIVLECEGWDELFGRLAKLDSSNDSAILFIHLRTVYLSLVLQHIAAEVLVLACAKNDIRRFKSARIFIVKQIKRRRCLQTDEEASGILDDETRSTPERIFSPHVLFYVARLSLGGIVTLLQTQLQSGRAAKIAADMEKLKVARDAIAHRLFSGRGDLDREFNEGIAAGLSAWKLLQQILREYDTES